MQDTEEFMIGEGERELRFSVTMLPAGPALLLFHRVMRSLAPAFAKAAGDGVAKALAKFDKPTLENLLDLDVGGLIGGLADGVGELFAHLRPEDTQSIVLELASSARLYVHDAEGGKLVNLVQRKGAGLGPFDHVFRGRMIDVFKLVGFVWRLNYGDFFNAFSALKASAERMRSSRKASPSSLKGLNTSGIAGQSGDSP